MFWTIKRERIKKRVREKRQNREKMLHQGAGGAVKENNVVPGEKNATKKETESAKGRERKREMQST